MRRTARRPGPRLLAPGSWPPVGPVVAHAKAQRAGRSLLFAEGEVRDASGTMLAKAVGTFKLIYPPGSKE